MSEVLCEDCKHPQARHIHGVGFCTVNIPNKVGVGYLACRCPAFQEKEEKEETDG